MGAAFVEILPNMKRWGAALKRDIVTATQADFGPAERRVNGFASRVKATLFSVRGAMGAALGAAAVATAGRWALGTASALQQAQISFETMLGSAEAATTFISDLKTFAASTPFELPGLIEASRQLVGAGTAAKDVIPTLQAYGDTAGALGLNQEQFKRVMLAVTQAMNKGKIQAEELMQITEAGIPIYPLLARSLGKPVSAIQDMASKGQLLSKDVLPLLQAQMSKEFGGAMAKQATTLSGLWSTFMDTLRLGLSDAIQPLIPTLSVALPAATAAMGGALKAASGALASFVAGLRGRGPIEGFSGTLNTLGLGLRALVAAFREGDVTSDGFVGAMERLGVVARAAWAGIRQLAGGFQNLLQFYREHSTTVEAVVGGVLAMWAAFKLYTIATRALLAIRVAVIALRAQFVLLTASMLANPIGIVVLALVGLVTALVIAYKRSETFRNVVNGVWASVKAAVGAAVTFMRSYFNNFVENLQTIGRGAMWLWRNGIVPAFAGIRTVIGVVVGLVGGYFKVWMAAVRVVAGVITWLWRNVVTPAFRGIGLVVRIFYALFKVYVGLITIAVKAVGAIFLWLYRNAVQPYLRAVGAVVTWLWRTVISPIFGFIGRHIQSVWRNVVAPALNGMRDLIANRVAPAFRTGVEAIRRAWDGVREAAKAPIRFVVNTVINRGIIDTYNKLAGMFGVGRVGHVSLPRGFARGGVVNTPTAIVGEGNTRRPEYVIPTDPRHRSRALQLYGQLGTQLLQGGGIIGKVGDIAGKIGGWIGNAADAITNPRAVFDRMLNELTRRIPGGGTMRQLATAIPKKLVGFVVAYIKKKFTGFELPGLKGISGGGGGSGFGLVQFGRLLQAMGFRVSEHPAFGGVDAVHTKGSRHYQGRAIDVNWAAGTSRAEQRKLAEIIPLAHARGFRTIFMTSGHFDHAHIDYDQGGVLKPGVTMAVNRTRKNEYVNNGDQLGELIYHAMVRALADAGVEVSVTVDGEEFKKVIRVESKKVNSEAASALKVGRR